jgi:hypothetical protein
MISIDKEQKVIHKFVMYDDCLEIFDNDFINELNDEYDNDEDRDDFLHMKIDYFVSHMTPYDIEHYIYEYGFLKALKEYKDEFGDINIENGLGAILYMVLKNNIYDEEEDEDDEDEDE